MAFCWRRGRGFSLIELLIVLAILSTILSLGLFMSFDSYRGLTSRSERDVIVSLLQKTRSRAMANLFQTRWGFCFASPSYVMFRGTYIAGAATNETIAANVNVVTSGLPVCGAGSEIVFEQLTGSLVPQLTPATSETKITVTQSNGPTTIAINNEGRINW